MAKLTKDELITKYTEKFSDNEDLAMEVLEDIEDSFLIPEDKTEELESLKSVIAEKEAEVSSLKQKYIERFGGAIKEVEEEIVTPEVEELKEEEIIDVKSI